MASMYLTDNERVVKDVLVDATMDANQQLKIFMCLVSRLLTNKDINMNGFKTYSSRVGKYIRVSAFVILMIIYMCLNFFEIG